MIYTIYSPSHVGLYGEFTKNLNKLGLNWSSKKVPQIGTGDYPGSTEFWKLNIEYFLELCEENSSPFLYLDCDVMVLQDPMEDLQNRLGKKDFIAQLDKWVFGFPQICTGIMYIRPSDKVKRMFEWMLKNIKDNDQKAMNTYLLRYPYKIRWGYLPKTYYSINYDNGNKVWSGNLKIKKRDYKMVHLNWCIGNKLKLWREIERRISDNS